MKEFSHAFLGSERVVEKKVAFTSMDKGKKYCKYLLLNGCKSKRFKRDL